jgi:hypothetical protein
MAPCNAAIDFESADISIFGRVSSPYTEPLAAGHRWEVAASSKDVRCVPITALGLRIRDQMHIWGQFR